MLFRCPHCSKRLKSDAGVRMHIDQSPRCLLQEREKLGVHQLTALSQALRQEGQRHIPTRRDQLARSAFGHDLGRQNEPAASASATTTKRKATTKTFRSELSPSNKKTRREGGNQSNTGTVLPAASPPTRQSNTTVRSPLPAVAALPIQTRRNVTRATMS